MGKSVFTIWVSNTINRKGVIHYPRYKVTTWRFAITSTLEKAESLMREDLAGTEVKYVRSIKIQEKPLDRPCHVSTSLSS